MKIQELKQKAWEAWQTLSEWKGQLLQPENFVLEVKQIGDRRYKATWIKALTHFEALVAYKGCLDAHILILHSLNFTPDRWDYEYRHEILDEFLSIPEGLDLIKTGLEQLFSSDFTHQERQEAHGFFELVGEQQERGISLPTRPTEPTSEARATA